MLVDPSIVVLMFLSMFPQVFCTMMVMVRRRISGALIGPGTLVIHNTRTSQSTRSQSPGRQGKLKLLPGKIRKVALSSFGSGIQTLPKAQALNPPSAADSSCSTRVPHTESQVPAGFTRALEHQYFCLRLPHVIR